MCLKSNSSNSKNNTCKCANACFKNHFAANDLGQPQSDKIKLAAKTERFRPVFESVFLTNIRSKNGQLAFPN